MNWNEFDKWCAALCCWREARGEGRDGMRGVLHVIANRAMKSRRSWAEVVYMPWQFSSMTASKDPQLTKVPTQPDANFADCYELADLIYQGGDFDLTDGATHYFADSIDPPVWTASMTPTGKIGHHSFFREG